MCVDCVLALPRIAQVDPSNGALPDVVLSHSASADSKFMGTLLIVNQANNEWSCLDDGMSLYC
jgi:hypothetical protein